MKSLSARLRDSRRRPTPAKVFPDSSRRGFTLVELLLVVAVIAILAALLFPLFGMARQQADSAQCLSQLKQIGTGLSGYINDHDGLLPGPLTFKQSATRSAAQVGSLADFLSPYLGLGTTPNAAGSSYFPIFECPAAARLTRDQTTPTYLANMLTLPGAGQAVWGDADLQQQPVRVSQLSQWNDASMGDRSAQLAEIWAIQDADQNYVAHVPNIYSGPFNDLLPNPAHVDHYNDLFFDFHVAPRQHLITVQMTSPTPPPTSGSGSA